MCITESWFRLLLLFVQTEKRFVECREKDTPIAAVIVEPIQAEGGEWYISAVTNSNSLFSRRQTCQSCIFQGFASTLQEGW